EGRPELAEVRDALGDIVADARRAGALIERVRPLARRSAPEQAQLQLAEVVAEVVALAAADAVARRLTIRTNVAADLPGVVGDRVQLQQVLLNLIVNAMDAMSALDESQRTLDIRASGHGRRPAGGQDQRRGPRGRPAPGGCEPDVRRVLHDQAAGHGPRPGD